MNDKKIWCCGQVGGQGELANILEIVSLKDYFDGFSWCVNYQNEDFSDDDGTYKLLNENKKAGKVVRANWVNINSLGMTMAIQSGVIKHGDWIILIDSQEILKIEFLKSLRENIEKWEKEGVGSVWWGRPYIFQFSMEMTFQPQSVHCMVTPVHGKAISIQDESKVRYEDNGVHFGDFLFNKKKFNNSMLLHGVKYSLQYVSNQFNMFYQDESFQQHETNRRRFILNLENLGFERTLDGLEKFMRSEHIKEFKEYLNYEFVFRDFYRYKILGHDINDIVKDRFEYRITNEI